MIKLIPILSKSLICLFLVMFIHSCTHERELTSGKADYSSWNNYAGTKDGMRYSSDSTINKSNVQKLKVAWKYSTKDKDANGRSQNQCNPIVVDGILYGTSPKSKLFALNASSGEELWIFDPTSSVSKKNDQEPWFNVIRGVTYWESQNKKDKRIFYSSGSTTFCINAQTGKLVRSFGKEGKLDLSLDLDRDPNSFNPYIASTTPGIIYKELLILPMRVVETADAAPGHIRAYSVKTGKLQWIFHTIPHPGEFGYETWPDKEAYKTMGGANNWAGMTLDEKRGIVYVPTGSVSSDFYGGIRKGQNLFANSLIALNAQTGKYLWHYQIVHHDLWDRDLPANPNLLTLIKEGIEIDVVAQITKHGYIFIFDRETGKPIYEITERPVPQNALPGEEPWPTQPIPTLPEPFARQNFTEEDLNDLDPETYPTLLEKFKKVKYHTMFTPPNKEPSFIFPGFDGGGEWGGAAVDPDSQILYVNNSEMPWILTMIDVPKNTLNDHSFKGIGQVVYNKYCIACHGIDRKGNGPTFPSLIDIQKKYSKLEISALLNSGRNMMPSFSQLPDQEKEPLLAFILDTEEKEPAGDIKSKDIVPEIENSILDKIPFVMTGYNKFTDANGYPGIKPPWGSLNAINLNTGKLLWKVPLGEYPELKAKGIPVTGTENYGGPVVTKGGLIFIAATLDSKIRAFDKISGEIWWEHDLPVPGYATPALYQIEGKQYVVIACGGGKLGSKSGDQYIAFTLP
ncbi:outer membrane protein assembly factor BamB family protein [Namhaeicola litoreus]|uniref:PQQ-binding-like beta-propeller repeat protein n=1 Tax=Namhaeicola litoreus TaxID=1052145 RepID=A0ABW3Y4P1_9FLAO